MPPMYIYIPQAQATEHPGDLWGAFASGAYFKLLFIFFQSLAVNIDPGDLLGFYNKRLEVQSSPDKTMRSRQSNPIAVAR